MAGSCWPRVCLVGVKGHETIHVDRVDFKQRPREKSRRMGKRGFNHV